MKQLAIFISAPIALVISMMIALIALSSAPPIIRWLGAVIVASIIGIGLYFFCLQKMRSMLFPYWDRLAQQLERTVEFRLGLIGHGFYIAMIMLIGYLISVMAVKASSKAVFVAGLAVMLLVLFTIIRSLALQSRWSPFYAGPSLVANPKGIKGKSCFIPWSDVVSTGTCRISAGKYSMTGVKIITRNICSEYSDDRSPKGTGLDLPEVKFVVLGALPESIAHYLEARARFQIAAKTS